MAFCLCSSQHGPLMCIPCIGQSADMLRQQEECPVAFPESRHADAGNAIQSSATTISDTARCLVPIKKKHSSLHYKHYLPAPYGQ